MILASFLIILAIFLIVGLASARVATGERKDYYLAGQSVYYISRRQVQHKKNHCYQRNQH